MKPKFTGLIVITIIMFLSSCSNDEYIEISDQCSFIKVFSSSCFTEPSGDKYDKFIFNDSAAFSAFADSMRLNSVSLNCDSATVPDIDFKNYILLGKYVSGGGCNVSFKKRLYRDITNLEIIYQINVKTTGWCDKLGYSNNWVLIPKSLFYEDVKFIVNE